MSRPVFTFTDEGEFRLSERWKYTIPNGTGAFVILPAGMRTNFATIPSIARAVINPVDPDIVVAATVHDWLVGEFVDRPEEAPVMWLKRRDGSYGRYRPRWSESARIMRTIMREEGAPWWKRTAVYIAVRVHGIIQRKG